MSSRAGGSSLAWRASWLRRRHWRHHRTAEQPASASDELAGRDVHRSARMHTAARNPSSTPRPPGTRTSASPSSSSRHRTSSASLEGRPGPQDVRVELPVGPQRQPPGDPAVQLASCQGPGTVRRSAPGSQVGTSAGDRGRKACRSALDGPDPVPVYNLVPKRGAAGALRLPVNLLGSTISVFLEADVDWAGDYHEGFTIRAVPQSPIGQILKNRLVFQGRAGNGTFLTVASTCFDPAQAGFEHVYSTLLRPTRTSHPNPTFHDTAPFFSRSSRRGSSRPAATKFPSSRRPRSTPAPSRPTRRAEPPST